MNSDKKLNRAYIVQTLYLGSDSAGEKWLNHVYDGSTMPLYQIILYPGFRDDVGPIYNSIFWISPSNPSFTIKAIFPQVFKYFHHVKLLKTFTLVLQALQMLSNNFQKYIIFYLIKCSFYQSNAL